MLKYLSRVVNYELGIDFNFYSLRYTHATMLLEAGGNIKYIQKSFAPIKLVITIDTYSHVTEKTKSDTVDLFESLVIKK